MKTNILSLLIHSVNRGQRRERLLLPSVGGSKSPRTIPSEPGAEVGTWSGSLRGLRAPPALNHMPALGTGPQTHFLVLHQLSASSQADPGPRKAQDRGQSKKKKRKAKDQP